MNGVSIVLCCYNSQERLVVTLEHLAAQEVNKGIPWEVILVDNNSTDKTVKTANDLWETYGAKTELIVLVESTPGSYFARQSGIAASKYDSIIFCDDDNWLATDYVQKVYDKLSTDGSIGIIGGQTFGVYQSTPPDWFLLSLHNFAIGKQGDKTGYLNDDYWGVWGAGSAYNKKLFQDLIKISFEPLFFGRIGEKLTGGEDRELCLMARKLGYKIFYDEALVCSHYMPSSRYSKDKFIEMSYVNGFSGPVFKYLEKPELFSFRDIGYSFLKSVWFMLKTRASISKATMSPLTKTYLEIKGVARKQFEIILLFKKYKRLFNNRELLLSKNTFEN
jgi:glycosyltransferase involved in cell wall biosynthesis